MEDSLDEPGSMGTFPPELQRPKRDNSLITVGLVVAVLIAMLVALPFVGHARHASRQAISSSPPDGTPAGVAR
jgi:hypothetical protein